MKETVNGPKEQKVYYCSNCNSMMQFDITTQKMKCLNCSTVMEISPDQTTIQEYDFNNAEIAKADFDWDSQVHMIQCQSCGAEITVSRNATTVSCAFCGSANVLEQKQEAGIRPEAILPFKVDKNKAGEIFRKWIKGRILAPNVLKKMYQQDKLQALYIPYWTYDADTNSSYTAQGGEVYYVTVGSGKEARQERRVRWYPVQGNLQRFFDDILVNAGSKHADLITKIDQFNTSNLVPFSSVYLSGFMSEKYELDPKAGFDIAKGIINDSLTSDAERQVLARYDEVRGVSLTTSYANVKFKHVLFPFWSSGFMFKNKIYHFVINGSSGRITGKYPLSPVKITILVILCVIIVIALYMFTQNS